MHRTVLIKDFSVPITIEKHPKHHLPIQIFDFDRKKQWCESLQNGSWLNGTGGHGGGGWSNLNGIAEIWFLYSVYIRDEVLRAA